MSTILTPQNIIYIIPDEEKTLFP